MKPQQIVPLLYQLRKHQRDLHYVMLEIHNLMPESAIRGSQEASYNRQLAHIAQSIAALIEEIANDMKGAMECSTSANT